jgi:predicted dinucleotide-binding enzyme
MSKIAFIGLGNMGAPMAANLVKAGHAVTGFDLVDAAKTAAAASGVTIAPSAPEAVASADTVLTMLPDSFLRRPRARWSSIARPSTLTAPEKRTKRAPPPVY